jgi:hypothetical protein
MVRAEGISIGSDEIRDIAVDLAPGALETVPISSYLESDFLQPQYRLPESVRTVFLRNKRPEHRVEPRAADWSSALKNQVEPGREQYALRWRQGHHAGLNLGSSKRTEHCHFASFTALEGCLGPSH